MATLGSLILKLEAQHAELKQGLDEVRGEMHKTGESARSMGETMRHALEALGIAEVANKLREVATEILHTHDETSHFADTLGITTNSLQKLQFAGKSVGLTSGEMNAALGHMSKAFAEVGKGGGEAADSLKELGITAAELRGKTPDQQFRVLAEAIAHTKDSSVATR